MDFRIADTFTGSLARLTTQEQKAAKTTAFDLQMGNEAPGLSFHKLDRAQDKNFWSVRVNADIRLIVHRSPASLLLAYVDHHDAAYKWAERRKIERHPTTGAMQLVEVRERVEEAIVFAPKPAAPKPKLFDNLRKYELMNFGVPEEWVNAVRAVDEDTLFDLIDHLPQEAQEALLKLAVGERPETPVPAPVEADPFTHPDARRRFRSVANPEELQRALDYPWDKWAVFLHPAQEALVARNFGGAARVSGSAGTGKTIVALHRAVHLARANPAGKVLLTTFSGTLANALKRKMAQLTAGEPALASRITVQSLSGIAMKLYTAQFGAPEIAASAVVRAMLSDAAKAESMAFPEKFLLGEWLDVVDAWQIRDGEGYRDVSRLGRKTRLGGKQREGLWALFQRVQVALAERGLVTWAGIFGRLTETLAAGGTKPFDFAVVDEAQDLGIAQARFLAALAGKQSNALFFAGDLGQRIFQQPFSWKALGLDVRGRSATLRINYRTSHQIRTRADRLLPGSVSDVDGNSENRRGTVSMFEGVAPDVRTFPNAAGEEAAVAEWIAALVNEGYAAHEIAIFVRADPQLSRARAAAEAAGVATVILSEATEDAPGHIAICTMHLAKGLEFRAVAVMACDDEVIPLQERFEAVADDSDLDEVYDTERHLLYVACTRPRDRLLVTGVHPASEFLTDFG